MSWQSEYKDECVKCGYVHIEHGIEVCPASKDKRCWAHSCPSYHYDKKPEVSRHKFRALEKVGLVEEYEAEVENG